MNRVEFYLEDLKSKFSKINPSEYYLAYSGGRDSHFLLWFIREYLHETRIPAVFSNTGMEIPEIRDRALANCDVVLKPVMKHFEIKERYGIPLNSKMTDDYVWRYRMLKEERGVTDENMPYYIRHCIFHEIDATERGKRTGQLSYFAVPKKIAQAVIKGTLHRVSPFCCNFMKKEPAKKYESVTGYKPIIGIMGGGI